MLPWKRAARAENTSRFALTSANWRMAGCCVLITAWVFVDWDGGYSTWTRTSDDGGLTWSDQNVRRKIQAPATDPLEVGRGAAGRSPPSRRAILDDVALPFQGRWQDLDSPKADLGKIHHGIHPAGGQRLVHAIALGADSVPGLQRLRRRDTSNGHAGVVLSTRMTTARHGVPEKAGRSHCPRWLPRTVGRRIEGRHADYEPAALRLVSCTCRGPRTMAIRGANPGHLVWRLRRPGNMLTLAQWRSAADGVLCRQIRSQASP